MPLLGIKQFLLWQHTNVAITHLADQLAAQHSLNPIEMAYSLIEKKPRFCAKNGLLYQHDQ